MHFTRCEKRHRWYLVGTIFFSSFFSSSGRTAFPMLILYFLISLVSYTKLIIQYTIYTIYIILGEKHFRANKPTSESERRRRCGCRLSSPRVKQNSSRNRIKLQDIPPYILIYIFINRGKIIVLPLTLSIALLIPYTERYLQQQKKEK